MGLPLPLQVSYKTLGFLPGRARQQGEIEPINSDTFQVGRAVNVSSHVVVYLQG